MGRKILDFSCMRTKPRLRSNSVSSLPNLLTQPSNKTVLDCSSNVDCGLQPSKKPQIGDSVLTEGKIIVRETESMSSPKILVFGKTSTSRVKVLVDGTIGWVTLFHMNLHEP